MPEPYAVRWTGGARGVGKREVYWTKSDYHAGRVRASDSARKRSERAFGNTGVPGAKSNHLKGRDIKGNRK